MSRSFSALKRLNQMVIELNEKACELKECQSVDKVNENLEAINEMIDEMRHAGDIIEYEAARMEDKKRSKTRKRAVQLADAFTKLDLNDREPISDLSELDQFVDDLTQLETQLQGLSL